MALLAAALTRELGGGPFARALAAVALGPGTCTLVAGHRMAASTTDFGVSIAVTWLVARILRTGRERPWLAVGAVVGIGPLSTQQLPVFLMFARPVGVLRTAGARPCLQTPWPYLGRLLAVAAWTPVPLWHAQHGWPHWTLAGPIHNEDGQSGERIDAAAPQFVMFSSGATVRWVLGLWRLLRDPAWPDYRPLAWAWPVLMSIMEVTAGQGYYPAGLNRP